MQQRQQLSQRRGGKVRSCCIGCSGAPLLIRRLSQLRRCAEKLCQAPWGQQAQLPFSELQQRLQTLRLGMRSRVPAINNNSGSGSV